jgi:anti-anti-sigma factor
MSEPPADSQKPRIEVDEDGGVRVITLHGEHDVSTWRSLRDQLECVEGSGRPVVVDLSRASFIDSTIISVVAVAHQNHREIALVAPTHYNGTRLVELIGIGTVIPTFSNRAAAIAAARSLRS